MELPKELDYLDLAPDQLGFEMTGKSPADVRRILMGVIAARRLMILELLITEEFSDQPASPSEQSQLGIDDQWAAVDQTLAELGRAVLEIRDSRNLPNGS